MIVNHLDIFKKGISLPGISLKYAMKTTDANFAIYGEKFKWFYKDLRQAITGGPSIIFSRHQEKDVTKIRENSGSVGEKIGLSGIVFETRSPFFARKLAEKTPTRFQKQIKTKSIFHRLTQSFHSV